MSRDKGIAAFSANFEPQVAAPLDARFLCSAKSDLVLTSTWTANDGGIYSYKGMIVSVHSDPIPSNNGLYRLTDIDYTSILNWENIANIGGTNPNIISKTAGEIIHAFRAIRLDHNDEVWMANSSNSSESNSVIGVSLSAAALGDSLSFAVSGEIIEPTWSWLPDLPIVVNGLDGQLSQTPPITGYSLIIATPTSPTSLFVKINRPIILI